MKLNFTKMHGAGNDYVYVDGFKYNIDDPSKVSIKVSDRHKGVGADGLIIAAPSSVADVRMIMYNADGSRGKMCGNGSRCVAKFAYERGYVKGESLTLETDAGIKNIKLDVGEDGKVKAVTVNMGTPILKAEDIPVITDNEELIKQMIDIGGQSYEVTCVSMGNPHCVVFTGTPVSQLKLLEIGPLFENADIFPERVNTEFVNVINDHTLDMRVWERGSGETLACGTGACATAVAAVLAGYCGRQGEITVRMTGGELKLNWADDGNVYMKGDAVEVFCGCMDI